MSARKEYLTRVFSDYLARKTVPRDFADNEKAQSAEFAALVRTVLRSAPEINYQEWWPRFEDAADSIMQTRVWPSVNQLRAAAKLTHKGGSGTASVAINMDSASINARRILRGDPVGDEWIYGRSAVEAIQSGQITEDNLRPYRSGMYFAMRDVIGEDAARERERQYQRRHDEARIGAGLRPIFSQQLEAAE